MVKSGFKRFLKGIVPNIILLFYTITCIFPAIWLFYSALKTKKVYHQPGGAAEKVTFENFEHILGKGNFPTG